MRRVTMLKTFNKTIITTQPACTFFKNFFKRESKISSETNLKTSSGKYGIVKPWPIVSDRKSVPSYIPKPSYAESSIPCDRPKEAEIKDKNQIECMRHSCILARQILGKVRNFLKVGFTTEQLDAKLHQLIIDNGAYPSPLNYQGFPKSICTSINNVACHGIPDSRPLHNGDILNVDITVFLNGYHGDCSAMFKVGEVDEEARQLIDATETCLSKAISICKPNENFSSIGQIIEETAQKHGFGIVPAFAGHGIGNYFHGPPDICHFKNDEPGKMQTGMTFTIEPVLTQGGPDVEILEDGWTAVTTDNARTAQAEHTILITDTGSEILTQ
ncbi:methionine aminopeptidase 1D, mitochondrial [Neodiprion pinetum]|uniref:methionine aminopeptidase 1D, mitochondrial n=1 Tax=Neodiprion pinetum TaxID=441929 RepID=UPI001EDCEB12|nr:methionine aminopeptidase 1D, mitochondrial [Neodiprion pinetum]XP_046478831.1 methionine aminopeptidase 1D, mitochondrial [Neodiprion pinetum]